MWKSRNKTDLIVEVWEKLDCETVGASEIEAIETAVEARFGKAAVPSPMRIARMLADEGADLRHSEVMELHLRRFGETTRDPKLEDPIDLIDLASLLRSIRKMDNLRRKYEAAGRAEQLRKLRDSAIEAKADALARAKKRSTPAGEKKMLAEAANWLTLWLQSPQLFDSWLKLRRSSPDFVETFGKL